MRIHFSDKVNQLDEMIDPYREWNGIYCHIREDAPEEIKQAEKEWKRLSTEEYNKAMCL